MNDVPPQRPWPGSIDWTGQDLSVSLAHFDTQLAPLFEALRNRPNAPQPKDKK